VIGLSDTFPLRLGLSYDVVKAHGSEIIVESKEAEGSTFTITLPFIANQIKALKIRSLKRKVFAFQ